MKVVLNITNKSSVLIAVLLLIVIGFTNCNSAKQVAYFQDVPDSTNIVKRVRNTSFVKPVIHKGDILNISPAIVGSTFETISSKFLLNRILNLFVEIDFYTNTVVVVKDISELTNEDLILIVSETLRRKM